MSSGGPQLRRRPPRADHPPRWRRSQRRGQPRAQLAVSCSHRGPGGQDQGQDQAGGLGEVEDGALRRRKDGNWFCNAGQ